MEIKTTEEVCPPAFFRCLSNLGTFMELRTMSFIETTGVVCSDSISHNQVQVLSIPWRFPSSTNTWRTPEDILAEMLWK